jgi:glutaredoxin
MRKLARSLESASPYIFLNNIYIFVNQDDKNYNNFKDGYDAYINSYAGDD